jgi:hypothetical protein
MECALTLWPLAHSVASVWELSIAESGLTEGVGRVLPPLVAPPVDCRLPIWRLLSPCLVPMALVMLEPVAVSAERATFDGVG